jgi:hypothetical protein
MKEDHGSTNHYAEEGGGDGIKSYKICSRIRNKMASVFKTRNWRFLKFGTAGNW